MATRNETGQASRRLGEIALSLAALMWTNSQPAAAKPASCNYLHIRTMPIEFSGVRPTVDGSINGHAATMLIDTGSDQTVLLRSAVEKFGLRIGTRSGTSTGTNGISDAYDVRLREFKIGTNDVDGSELAVVWHAMGNLPYDVLIGASFLFEHDLELDLSHQTIGFFRPEPKLLPPFPCSSAFLAYWDERAFAADLTTMSKDDLRPVVTVEVNGKKVRAMIDTGATVSTISPAAAARAGVTPRSEGVQEVGYFDGIGNHRRKGWLAPFDTFSLGGEIVRNAQLYVKDISWTGGEDGGGHWFSGPDLPEMILGVDFLKAHRALFAMSQGRLYFSYLGGPVLDGTPKWSADGGALGKQAASGQGAPRAECAPQKAVNVAALC